MTKKTERDWRKIKYYPVSIEKLQRASMKEVAYLIGPVNIGEDYEYFEEVKHLLAIPEESNSLEEIQQEFHEKIDKLIEKTKRNFYASNLTAERNYQNFCDRQDSAFEYMQKNGRPPLKYYIDYSKVPHLNPGIISGSNVTFEIKPTESIGYYEISPDFHLWLKQKPSRFFRFMIRILLNWRWKNA